VFGLVDHEQIISASSIAEKKHPNLVGPGKKMTSYGSPTLMMRKIGVVMVRLVLM
jgi:hypothetical protein